MPHRSPFVVACSILLGSQMAAAQTATTPGGPSPVPPPRPAPAGTLVPPPPTPRDAQERALREALQKLSPEKRRQVLDVMKAVWADDDVRQAREELRRATEAYRRTLRAAMEETDPEIRASVRPLIDRLLKAGINMDGWSDSASPHPDPGSEADESAGRRPRFLRLLGLRPEDVATLSPEDRRLLGSARDKIMGDARVQEAAAALAATVGNSPARPQAVQHLRRTARAVAIELEPRLRPLLENHRSDR